MPQGRQVVFDTITSSQTVELHQFPGLEPTSAAGSILIEMVGSNQSLWDVDIQGKLHEDGQYENVDYVEIFIAGEGKVTRDHVHIETIEHRFFILTYPPPLVQLEAVSRRGTLTVFVSFVSSPFNVPVGNARMIELLELILQGINSNLINQIGTAEIMQGIGTQLANITGLELSQGEF